VADWGRTTIESIVEELQRPVRLDESFERRVMVRVRRLFAERRKQRGWLGVAAKYAQRPAWATAMAAGLIAVVSFGVIRVHQSRVIAANGLEPVNFVLVAPEAKSVKVVGDFNNWGLNDSALVATNNQGVWSVTAPVPAGVHRYAFVVNEKQWVADPRAPRSVGDDFGMPSSALVVEDSTK
jgi:hypothetical protein